MTVLMAIGQPASYLRADVLYDVTIISPPVDAYISAAMAVNMNGEVIGWSLFSPAFIRGWRWTPASGAVLLPTPPGQSSRYWGVDINEQSVIAGDGAYDFGVAWTYSAADGYQMLGTLPGFNASRTPRINNSGQIVGDAFDQNSASVPTQAFRWTAQTGMTRLFPTAGSSAALDINDNGAILAVRNGIGVYLQPDGTEVPIPVPAGFSFARGARLNSLNDMAGVLACSHECNRPFLYTNDGQMFLIPIVATRHSVSGVMSDRTVIGGVTQGVSRGWRWTPDRGTELLQTLIDPALNMQIWDALGINEAGQIVAQGADLDDTRSPRRMMLLTPIEVTGDIDGDRDVDATDQALFVEVLLGFDADPLHVSRSDLNSDASTDGQDISAFVAALLAP